MRHKTLWMLVGLALLGASCEKLGDRDTCGYLPDGKPVPVQEPVAGDPRYTNNNDGTITDTLTSDVWEQAHGSGLDFEAAQKRCNELTTGGKTWTLPTIDQLRSLVIGCKATALDGPCKADTACLTECLACQAECEGCVTDCAKCAACATCNTTCYAESCYGCAACEGKGRYGCYMDSIFTVPCGYYVSSTTVDILDGFLNAVPNVYGVEFVDGYVFLHALQVDEFPNLFDVRCVVRKTAPAAS